MKRLSNEKKSLFHMIILTLSVIVILSVFIGYSIKSVDNTVTQSCFHELAKASQELAGDLRSAVDGDEAVLTAMATMISIQDEINDQKLCEIMQSYDLEASYLSYIEILRPDNTMLDADGTIRDVSGMLDFATEFPKGIVLSSAVPSTLDPKEQVLRKAIPITRDGSPVLILYGTVRLSDFAKKFQTNIYDGNAYIFLEDGDTGDFLIDTWHKELGNLSDFKNRKLKMGYTWEKASEDLKAGRSGRLAIVSTSIHEVTYLHYEPTGINNFNVMVMTAQEIALAESQEISSKLYIMALVVGDVLLVYMCCIIASLLKAYNKVKRMGIEDQSTGLLNRNAYEKYAIECQNRIFPKITCIYIDVNGLHDINNQYGHAAGDQMLLTVADTLKEYFRKHLIYRIGGDEFVVLCEGEKVETYEMNMKKAEEQINMQNYSISYGIVTLEDETGIDHVTKKADERMLEHKGEYYKLHDRRQRHS